MKNNPRLLPDGIEEILPGQAWKLEMLRRKMLDMFSTWGYQLVIPPLMEYLESLLTGTGHDLDLQTFKITDQLSGRMMGIRADITPQIARIDACHLQSTSPTRLCYIGTVLRTRSDSLGGTRSPMQMGAELYGHTGSASDVEILCLMIETLMLAGIRNVCIDLGHVGIYRLLCQMSGLPQEREFELFEMLQRKAQPEIRTFLQTTGIKESSRKMLAALVTLNGDITVLQQARIQLANAGPDVQKAIDYLQEVADTLLKRIPEQKLHIDLAELRGYQYKTGIVFAAFAHGQGQEIARGGRYDGISQIFGCARPATGFSVDLKTLVLLSPESGNITSGIYAPYSTDIRLHAAVAALRAQGERVIYELPEQNATPAEMGCDRILVLKTGDWIAESL